MITLQLVQIGNINRLSVTVHQHHNCQTDGGFGSSDGQYEEYENLSGGIAQMLREGDKVEVYRQKHQLDRHQQDQHVLRFIKMPIALIPNRSAPNTK